MHNVHSRKLWRVTLHSFRCRHDIILKTWKENETGICYSKPPQPVSQGQHDLKSASAARWYTLHPKHIFGQETCKYSNSDKDSIELFYSNRKVFKKNTPENCIWLKKKKVCVFFTLNVAVEAQPSLTTCYWYALLVWSNTQLLLFFSLWKVKAPCNPNTTEGKKHHIFLLKTKAANKVEKVKYTF